MEYEFVKYHGLGNDFVFLEDLRGDLLPEGEELARLLCHRHFGIGADGLVLIVKDGDLFTMRIFNPDGSEAEMCGNAVRCMADYLLRQGLASGPVLPIGTLAGVKEVQATGGLYRVDMGEPDLSFLGGGSLGIAESGREWVCHPVSMGNPHGVVFVDEVDSLNLAVLGPALENAPVWPHKANIEFVQVLDQNRIKVRVWERGAGPTLACGTGACAAAVVSMEQGHCQTPVRVGLPGGELTIGWQEGGHVFMSGPATRVFAGRIDLEALRSGR
ncbi:MAG TPA: diaminopimelate epimerase [Firmicutes bacterium]|nr:diaminopimelate epimerase [Bacillota bacterium]